MFEVSHELMTRVTVDELTLDNLTRIQIKALTPRFNENIKLGFGINPEMNINSAPRYRIKQNKVQPDRTNNMVVASFDAIRNAVNLNAIPTTNIKIEICWASSEKIIIIKTVDYTGSSGAKYRILLTGSPILCPIRRVNRSRKIKEYIGKTCRCLMAFCVA